MEKINLLKNYGQHNANLCGFRSAVGDWVITMDDDLQNPPEEIEKLIGKAEEGYELIIGHSNSIKNKLIGTLPNREECSYACYLTDRTNYNGALVYYYIFVCL